MPEAIICGKIAAAILRLCDIGSGGTGQVILLGNRTDIDDVLTVVDRTNVVGVSCTHKITALIMKSGKQMFRIEGLPGKRMLNAGFVFNDGGVDAPNTWTHSINGRAFNLTEDAMCFIKNLGQNPDMFAIVIDSNTEGTVDGFKVYGFDRGMKLSELAHNFNENNGTAPFAIASIDPDLEPHPPYIWIETDPATTLAKFINNLATP